MRNGSRKSSKIRKPSKALVLFLAFVLISGGVFCVNKFASKYFSIANAISVKSISPNRGPIQGGTLVTISGDEFIEAQKITQIAAGSGHSMALDSANTLYVWGGNDYGQLGNGSLGGSILRPDILNVSTEQSAKIVYIAAGTNTSYAIDENGILYAWGDGYYGQIGNGDLSDVSVPSKVNGAGGDILSSTKIKAVAAGTYQTLAIDYDGNIYVWGFGYLGNDAQSGQYDFPVKLNGVNGEASSTIGTNTNITAIASGNAHSFALDEDGNIYGWGYNTSGEVGNGTTSSFPNFGVAIPTKLNGLNGNSPTTITSETRIVDVSAGVSHSVAVDSLGNIYSWGDNTSGKLGNGSAGGIVNVPTKIDLGESIKKVSVGGVYSLALDDVGRVYSWGWEGSGQLGNGSMSGEVHIPTVINGVNGNDSSTISSDTFVVDIFAGEAHAKALDASGNLFVWGINTSGQLGDGSTTNNAVPRNMIKSGDFSGSITFETTVVIGGSICKDVRIIDRSTLSCVTTAHAAGLADVVVSNGVSSVILNDAFTYEDIGVPDTGR